MYYVFTCFLYYSEAIQLYQIPSQAYVLKMNSFLTQNMYNQACPEAITGSTNDLPVTSLTQYNQIRIALFTKYYFVAKLGY